MLHSVELPRYIGHIEGFSAEKGRMYFRGNDGASRFTSRDGRLFEVTDVTPTDLASGPALVVPGKTGTDLAQIPQWPDSDYQGECCIPVSALRMRTVDF